ITLIDKIESLVQEVRKLRPTPQTDSERLASVGNGDIDPFDTLGQGTTHADSTFQTTGKYVVWAGPPLTDAPRYVLLTWAKDAVGIGFKLRDYLDGRLLQHRGAAPGPEQGFELAECPIEFEAVWSATRCHILARGELDHAVKDFRWWVDRLGN